MIWSGLHRRFSWFLADSSSISWSWYSRIENICVSHIIRINNKGERKDLIIVNIYNSLGSVEKLKINKCLIRWHLRVFKTLKDSLMVSLALW